MKKKILLCNEASFLNTGFAVYGKEILSRLYQTDKYELAEFAAYGQPSDARQNTLPWKYYGNAYDSNASEAEIHDYNSNVHYQWGEWKFEQTCLDFQPDIVWDIRDNWMMKHEITSPFRPFYHLVWMPTVDAAPQSEDWIAEFTNVNGVFTYSEWALEVLNKQGSGLINLCGSASPGVNLSDFSVVPNKNQHKVNLGLSEDALVIGTVMRNQKRKLYPDLMNAFAEFISVAPDDIKNRAVLYLHTFYPDSAGWNLPRLIKENGIGNRTYLTYICNECGAVFPNLYADARTFCRTCGKYSATLPGVENGTSRQTLGSIFNLFDVYVQYAICEGFGIPLIEAACCNVPCMAVDYSAMSDVIRKIGGTPIKVERFEREVETHRLMALPDNKDLIKKLIDFFNLSEIIRRKQGSLCRTKVREHYNWDATAKKWEDYFDNVIVAPIQERWQSPPQIIQPNTNLPANVNNEEFIQWAMINIAGRPDLCNSYVALRLTRDLNWGITQTGSGGIFVSDASLLGLQNRWSEGFTRERAAQELLQLCEFKNYWEERRRELPRIQNKLS